ncbi:c-type cytochrome [bacterium]|nr:c-type cytochrome [bacterium]
MTIRSLFKVTVVALSLVGLSSCDRNPERREIQYMPDMYFSQAVKPQEPSAFFADGSGMRTPPAGTISRDFVPYPYSIIEGEKAGRELVNPVPVSAETLATGRKYYNIHCKVCHGVVGSGDGMVTLAHREKGMPIPPQLYSDKIRSEWADGQIFHTIKMGQGQMPAYDKRMTDEQKWAVVHYVRALGRAAHPTEADLAEVEKLGWKDAKALDNPYREDIKPAQLYLGGTEK